MGEDSTIRWSIVSNLAGVANLAINDCKQITDDFIYLHSFCEDNLKYVHCEAVGYKWGFSTALWAASKTEKVYGGQVA